CFSFVDFAGWFLSLPFFLSPPLAMRILLRQDKLPMIIAPARPQIQRRDTKATPVALRDTRYERYPLSSLVTRHSSFVTRHSSLVTRHSSFVIRHSSLEIASHAARTCRSSVCVWPTQRRRV